MKISPKQQPALLALLIATAILAIALFTIKAYYKEDVVEYKEVDHIEIEPITGYLL